jgi:predicted ATP-dependent protease
VNQFGEVQPVGGVNAKVEGFWKVCRDRGLTGAEGVILPASNVKNLQLDKDLVADARRGRFHVHAVRTVGQAMELLTGLPAGRRRRNGSWTPGSLGARVDERLRAMAVTYKRFADGPSRRGIRA